MTDWSKINPHAPLTDWAHDGIQPGNTAEGDQPKVTPEALYNAFCRVIGRIDEMAVEVHQLIPEEPLPREQWRDAVMRLSEDLADIAAEIERD